MSDAEIQGLPSVPAMSNVECDPELQNLMLEALRSECVAVWDVAVTQSGKQGYFTSLQVAKDMGIFPCGEDDFAVSTWEDMSVNNLAPISGEEQWLDSLLRVVDVQHLGSFIKGLHHKGSNRCELTYASDCSGIDSPAIAVKSLLARLKDVSFSFLIVLQIL